MTALQAAVQALAFAPDDSYAVSAAHGERHVVFWHTAAVQSKKRKQAAGLISLQHPVIALCTCPLPQLQQMPEERERPEEGNAEEVAAEGEGNAALPFQVGQLTVICQSSVVNDNI